MCVVKVKCGCGRSAAVVEVKGGCGRRRSKDPSELLAETAAPQQRGALPQGGEARGHGGKSQTGKFKNLASTQSLLCGGRTPRNRYANEAHRAHVLFFSFMVTLPLSFRYEHKKDI